MGHSQHLIVGLGFLVSDASRIREDYVTSLGLTFIIQAFHALLIPAVLLLTGVISLS